MTEKVQLRQIAGMLEIKFEDGGYLIPTSMFGDVQEEARFVNGVIEQQN